MTKNPKKTRLAVLLIAVFALVLSACGSDDNTTASSGDTSDIDCATGSVAGAGATFVQNIAQQWVKDYSAACSGATVNYQGVGSGAGIQQWTAGTVDFAGSDVPLTAAERTTAEAKHGAAVTVPWSAGAIAVEYKLSGVSDLQLQPETLGGIFSGAINKWDDAAIKADNPGKSLPSTAIQVIHRSDGSGTTAAFTAYLTAAAPNSWKAGSGKDIRWPVGQGARGSDGVTAAVKATEGAIGYAELSFAKANALGMVKVKNKGGAFIGPDAENGVTNALAEAEVPANLEIKPNYTPSSPEAYPISTVTYMITAKAQPDAAKAGLIKSFATYALGGGQDAATKLYYAPLPDAIVNPAQAAVAGIGTK